MDRTQALDQAKTAVFFEDNSAFLGCILNHMEFSWDSSIKTACVTSDMHFLWNPDWFDELTFQERQIVLLHELWHIACLHAVRGEGRDPKIWNIACDLRINNDIAQGKRFNESSFPEGALIDHKYFDTDWTEEKIYEDIKDKYPEEQAWGTEDVSLARGSMSSDDRMNQIQVVQKACTVGKFAGNLPGNVETLISGILKPKLPWKQILHNYLQDRINPEWSWSRPNKRYQDMYLPSLLAQDGRLISVAMFLDTSGSIRKEDSERFISEVKYIHSEFQPAKLSVMEFDRTIRSIKEFEPEDTIKDWTIKGSGGTSYIEVHNWIQKNKPTLAIIFTDLYADPMEPVGKHTNLIWVVNNNLENANQGKTIHVD